jgi:hypothetical protein
MSSKTRSGDNGIGFSMLRSVIGESPLANSPCGQCGQCDHVCNPIGKHMTGRFAPARHGDEREYLARQVWRDRNNILITVSPELRTDGK